MAALLLGTVVSILFALGEARQRIVAEDNTRRADNNAHEADAARREALRGTYRARVATALRTLGDHDYAEAALNLEAAPAELRGWEWQLIHQRLLEETPAVVPVPEIYRPILGLIPARRRMLVLVGFKDHYALIDARTATLERELPAGKTAVAMTTRAGATVLIYQPGAPLKLVDEVGRESQTRVPFDPGYVCWAMNLDGTRMAASTALPGPEHRLELRDLPTGELRRVLPEAGKPISLAFSPDGAWLAAACSDHVVRLWQIVGGSQTIQLRGHNGAIGGLIFSPDGQTLLSWGADGTLRQWQVATGNAIDVKHAHSQATLTAAYSPDGRYIVSGGRDRSVRLWSAQSDIALATLPGHLSFVALAAFHPDGETLVTYGWDRAFRFWPSPARSDPRVLRGHTSFVYTVACSPDERWFASGGWDNVVRLWDAASAEPIAVLHGPKTFVACLGISPDSSHLVCRANDGRLRVWDVGTGALRSDQGGGGLIGPAPHSVGVSPDDSMIAWGIAGQVRFRNLATGADLAPLALPTRSAVQQAVFSRDGKQLAIVAESSLLCLVDRESGKVRHKLLGHTGIVRIVAFSSDGKHLVSGGDDQVVRVWDTATGELQWQAHGHNDQIFAAAFHPDGSRIATAGHDRAIRIWDAASGVELARLQGHTDYIFSLAWSPDGRTLLSASGDFTVRLWDTVPLAQRRAAREELEQLRPEAEKLVNLLFQQEGSGDRVIEQLRRDKSLSEPMQRAAWHAVLRRQARP
jgi:WD40 repeat protein